MPAKPTLTYWDACVFLAYIGQELYTYDDRLLRLNGRIGCVICEPHVAQHRLPGLL